jgi:hypothetical protein
MEIRNAIMQMAEQDPQYSKAIDLMEAQIARMPIVPEDLDQAIQVLEFVLQNPDKYEEVRATAIRDGDIDPNMFPEQFDQVYIVSILVALYGVQDRLKTQGYARGGLAVAARRLQSAGRGGDTQLAHINDREAEMLKRMGGAGTINPNTGLREYKGGKELFATIAPIALAIFVPGLGSAIGASILGSGASALATGMLGGAILGGATSALTGGDWKKGALMGGLGGGLGGAVGEGANKAFGLELGARGQAILGSGLVGAGAGAITGQGVAKGALQGVAGGAIGALAGENFGGTTAFEQGVKEAGKGFGNAFTAGYDPKTAATIGVTSGLFKGLQTNMKPSDAVVDGLKSGDSSAPKTVTLPDGSVVPAPGTSGVDAQGRPGTNLLDPATGKMSFKPDAGSYQLNPQTNTIEFKAAEPSFMDKALKGSIFENTTPQTTTTGAKADTGMGMTSKVIGGLGLLSALQKPPPAAQEAINKMSPAQQEYFNRPSVTWDWNKMQTDANAANMSLDQFMASNWPRITGYAQTQPGQVATEQGAYNIPQAPVVNKARGGALSAVARFARGAGSGRADTIDAKLSDGEYVIDAETVAMLGDGSNQEGAKLLDAMRQNIRSHKGKAMAKGKFSPNAKSPLAYLKGVA